MTTTHIRLPQTKIRELIKTQQDSIRQLNQIILDFDQDIVALIVDPHFVEQVEDYANALLDLADTVINARREQNRKLDELANEARSRHEPIYLPARPLL